MHDVKELRPLVFEGKGVRGQIPRLRSGFRLRTQTPAKRLNLGPPPLASGISGLGGKIRRDPWGIRAAIRPVRRSIRYL